MKIYVESKDQIIEAGIDDRGRFTIPAEKRREFGLEDGDIVQMVLLDVMGGDIDKNKTEADGGE